MYKLNDCVIRIEGHASKLLNGLTSNGLDQPRNAFLNMHGRIISTFFQQRISDEEFLIVVPQGAVEGLLAHLDRYAKLNRSRLIKADLKAYVDLEGKDAFKITSDVASSTVSDDDFTRYRLHVGLPLMGIDYQADEFILNLQDYGFVSFTKGCFLGQEPVAKVHSRSKPARKLVVRYADELSPEEQVKMTSKSVDPRTGRTQGFVFVKNG